jgi:hypothetical protein
MIRVRVGADHEADLLKAQIHLVQRALQLAE